MKSGDEGSSVGPLYQGCDFTFLEFELKRSLRRLFEAPLDEVCG